MMTFIILEAVFCLLLFYFFKKSFIEKKTEKIVLLLITQVLIFGFTVATFLSNFPLSQVLICGITSEIGIAIAYIDIKTRQIDNTLLILTFIIGVVYCFVRIGPFYVPIITGIAVFIFMLIAYFIGKKQVGFGDVKLISAYGLIWSFPDIFNVLLYSLLAGLIFGCYKMLVNKGGIKTELPFAPFLIVGHILTFVLGVAFAI